MPARIQLSTSNDAFNFHAGPVLVQPVTARSTLRVEVKLVKPCPLRGGLMEYSWGVPCLCLQQSQWICWVLSLDIIAPGGHVNY